MFEIPWIIVPSVIGTAMVMLDKSFYANLLYCVGNLLLLYHNLQNGDMSQVILFGIYEIMSVIGVILYLHDRQSKRGFNGRSG